MKLSHVQEQTFDKIVNAFTNKLFLTAGPGSTTTRRDGAQAHVVSRSGRFRFTYRLTASLDHPGDHDHKPVLAGLRNLRFAVAQHLLLDPGIRYRWHDNVLEMWTGHEQMFVLLQGEVIKD